VIVILDWQHVGKPNRDDKGAAYDVDDDGDVDYEVELTDKYIQAAKNYLESRGHTVHIFSEGWYSARHYRANEIAHENDGPVAYIACHMNAGRGNYGATFYDIRSAGGKRLAKTVGSTLGKACPELRRIVVKGSSVTTWSRAFGTLRGIFSGPANISGMCFEPAFMDTPEHKQLLTDEGLERIGEALAVGVLKWSSGGKIS
jgi:N-acetylmuramoyl-L-alanine amidase